MGYPQIPGTRPILYKVPNLSSDDPLPAILTSPPLPTPSSKSIFAFWHAGIYSLPPYLLRNVLAWHRRFSPLGWTIYVLDTVPDSPLNVSRFLDTSSPAVFPAAFTSDRLSGPYAAHHTSDLVRYPLLLRYGGVYLDVGILQFGDLNWLWETHIATSSSPIDFAGFTMGAPPAGLSIVNFALMCGPGNPLVARAHAILLALWDGRTDTKGMHTHPLVAHVPLLRVPREVAVDDEGVETMVIDDEAMTDYAIQIQCMGAAQRWLDEEAGWDGPEYVQEKCWLYSMIEGAYVHEQATGWSGKRQHELLRLRMPRAGEHESEDQRLAREIVEKAVRQSWCMKLAHGFSAQLFGGETLGMLWRGNEGTDCEEGTYAGWLRWAEVSCGQNEPPKVVEVPVYEATVKGTWLPQLQR